MQSTVPRFHALRRHTSSTAVRDQGVHSALSPESSLFQVATIHNPQCNLLRSLHRQEAVRDSEYNMLPGWCVGVLTRFRSVFCFQVPSHGRCFKSKNNESGIVELAALLSYYFKVLVCSSTFELLVCGMYAKASSAVKV